jgi:hypothetical protein
MSREVYYRYFSHPLELQQLVDDRMIHTSSPGNGGKTWFTPQRFNDPVDALDLLALSRLPEYRVGPIRGDDMPDFDVCGPQRIEPMGGRSGGGIEVCTTKKIHIFGCYAFDSKTWVL